MRVEELAGVLSKYGLRPVYCIEERDPQYEAVARVYRRHGVSVAAVAAAVNALVSYRLAMKGEEWWQCWADFFAQLPRINDPRELVVLEEEFLKHCKGAVLARNYKIERLRKLANKGILVLEEVWRYPKVVVERGSWFAASLAKVLRAKPSSKTIVFAVKMAYYAVRVAEGRIPAPWDVHVPVDHRVACFLYSTGLVDVSSYKTIVSQPSAALRVLRALARLSGIPELNLDAVLWRVGWIPRDLPREKWREAILEVLGDCYPEIFTDELLLFLIRRCT